MFVTRTCFRDAFPVNITSTKEVGVEAIETADHDEADALIKGVMRDKAMIIGNITLLLMIPKKTVIQPPFKLVKLERVFLSSNAKT